MSSCSDIDFTVVEPFPKPERWEVELTCAHCGITNYTLAIPGAAEWQCWRCGLRTEISPWSHLIPPEEQSEN